MSWKAEMLCEGKWETNGLRFKTQGEAEAYASDLFGRWMVPTDRRAARSDDPVTHEIVDGTMRRIAAEVPVVVIDDQGARPGVLTSDEHGDLIVPDAAIDAGEDEGEAVGEHTESIAYKLDE